VNLRNSIFTLALPLTLASACSVGAGATVGLHYTTNGSLRVQLEVPLEANLVGSGTTLADRSRPYVRYAVVPHVFYDTKTSKFDGGARLAVGPVFASHGFWLAPAFNIGGTWFNNTTGTNGKGTLDVGLTMDLETPFSNNDGCSDTRFLNLLAPQISLTRHVDDTNHPLSGPDGYWDVGIAAGVRHIRVLTCGGGGNQPPPANITSALNAAPAQ